MVEIISKMAKKGMTPSTIGVLLRDNHGVGQLKSVTGSKILRILKAQGAWCAVMESSGPQPPAALLAGPLDGLCN